LYVSSSVLGYACVLAGQPSEALPLLEQYVATEAMQIMRGRVHGWLSEAYLRLGRLDEALAVAVRGLELCRMHTRLPRGPDAARQMGTVMGRGGMNPTLEGQPTQAVLLVGPDGVPVLALYPMQQQPDGSWKTAGCYLVPLKDEKL
jgi:Tetratricopeptide repeat